MKNKKVSIRNYGICTRFWCTLLLFAGCSENKSTSYLYYPVDSLLNIQTILLVNKKAILEKNAFMGKEGSKVVFTPADSLQWAKEIEIFRNLNIINKPVNRGAYEITEMKDRKSNLTVRSFVARKKEFPEKDLPVEFLNLYFLDHPDKLKKLEARYSETNPMFSARRELTLEFKETDRQAFISGYTIRGGQKMLLGDTVQYSVTARISLPKN